MSIYDDQTDTLHQLLPLAKNVGESLNDKLPVLCFPLQTRLMLRSNIIVHGIFFLPFAKACAFLGQTQVEEGLSLAYTIVYQHCTPHKFEIKIVVRHSS